MTSIEFPGTIIDKLKIKESPRSELAKKMVIINNDRQKDLNALKIADKLAEKRNLIVHDKPFNLIDNGEGEVEIEYYRIRKVEEGNEKTRDYEDLKDFFKDCDEVKSFILDKSDLADELTFTFSSLARN